MKTLIPLALLLLLLSSYKTYNTLEYKEHKSFAWTSKTMKELPFDKEMYRKSDVLSTKFLENFSVEIDGTFVSTKGLYKRHGLHLLSKKESLFIYKESIRNPFAMNEKKALAQLD
nr:hypothetical protein [uncultured Flavobacterium sp.]